jgi:hypothetical protein
MRTLGLLVAVTLAPFAFSTDALAGKEPAPLEGLTEVARLVPEEGLIETAIADDGAGQIAYVVADAASKAEVRVVAVATGKEVRRFAISALTSQPERLWFVGTGPKAQVFVVGKPTDAAGEVIADGSSVGALFDAAGKQAKKKFGPAAAVVLVTDKKGKPSVAVKKELPGPKKLAGSVVIQVERLDLKSGKRIGKAKKLTLVGDRDDKLGFTVNHWTRDGLVAVGTKDGTYDKKEDVRTPDREGSYDLLDGKGVVVKPIPDPMAHVRRFTLLAKEGGQPLFLRVADDRTGVELWRDDHGTDLELDQGFDLYDPKSLVWGLGDDGTVHVGLAIDPWNKKAVERKKQDPEYFDVFRIGADGKATRIARVLGAKKRYLVGATAGHVWLLERNIGFSRGGKALTIYKPAS